MEKHPIRQNYISAGERISLAEYYRKRKRFFALFLICSAFLVAVFAVTLILEEGAASEREPGSGDRLWNTGGTLESPSLGEEMQTDAVTSPFFEETQLRDPITDISGGTAILTMTLPTDGYGEGYINNESIQLTDPDGYLDWEVSSKVGQDPMVLILHTHTSEGYRRETQNVIYGDLGEVTYTSDVSVNVVAVGKTLSGILNKNGISTIHCTTIHDGDGRMGAYERAAESIRFFSNALSQYYLCDRPAS